MRRFSTKPAGVHTPTLHVTSRKHTSIDVVHVFREVSTGGGGVLELQSGRRVLTWCSPTLPATSRKHHTRQLTWLCVSRGDNGGGGCVRLCACLCSPAWACPPLLTPRWPALVGALDRPRSSLSLSSPSFPLAHTLVPPRTYPRSPVRPHMSWSSPSFPLVHTLVPLHARLCLCHPCSFTCVPAVIPTCLRPFGHACAALVVHVRPPPLLLSVLPVTYIVSI